MKLRAGMRYRDLLPKHVRNRQSGGVIPYGTAAQGFELLIDREEGIHAIDLRVTAVVACGAAPGALVPYPRSACALLQNFRLLVAGNEERNLPAHLAQAIGQYKEGRETLETTVFGTPGAGLTLTDVRTIRLHLNDKRLRDGEDHLGVVPGPTARISINWNWGVLADLMVVPGGSTATLTTASCNVEVIIHRRKIPGLSPRGYGSYVQNARLVQCPATTTAQPADLDGDATYTLLAIASHEAGVPAAGIFTAGGVVDVRRSGEQLVTCSLAQVLAKQRQRFPAGYDDTGVIIIDPIAEQSNVDNTQLSSIYCAPSEALNQSFGVTAGAASSLIVVGEKWIDPSVTFQRRGVTNAAA